MKTNPLKSRAYELFSKKIPYSLWGIGDKSVGATLRES